MSLAPNLFIRASVKKEVSIVMTAMTLIVCLPIIGLVAITNVGVLASPSVSLYDGPLYPGDEYAFGNCTYWVAMRRSQIGEPIPNTWGNAATWAIRAARDGYVVNHLPAYGAIMQTPYAAGGLGHVAFVESIDVDGTWHISEMNALGFDEVDYRAMTAASTERYAFIH